jgi:predicted phosphodiesterase
MQFSYISDIHIEMNRNWVDDPAYDGVGNIYPWHLESESDVLIIAGDCSNSPYTSMEVVEEASHHFEHVIWHSGNHEHYSNSRTKTTVGNDNRLFIKQADESNNITYLNDGHNDIQIGDTLFIGANNWYDWTSHQGYARGMQMEFWKQNMNDAKTIRFDKGGFPDKMARRQSERLRERVVQAQGDDSVKEIVVTTHTIPERSLGYPDNHPVGYLNGSYTNMLAQQIAIADKAGKIKVWLYGHTHRLEDRVMDGIRYVNNARGYYAHIKSRRENDFTGIKMIDTSEVMIGSAFGEID